jgi:hypothetical protein
LDTLWTTTAAFQKLDKNKAVFAFYFGDQDTVTVHGWKDKGGTTQFNTPPDVVFYKGHPDSVLTFGPGTYFGNLSLDKVNQLQKLILDSAASYVVFAPKKLGNHVYYKVYVTKESPVALAARTAALIASGDDANPSPPKNY